jgi:hypothetical protein
MMRDKRIRARWVRSQAFGLGVSFMWNMMRDGEFAWSELLLVLGLGEFSILFRRKDDVPLGPFAANGRE